ncbi:MAG: type I restriction-modification system subunit M [Nanoarchaeota archaeon]|nr:type I restriction-modification system subunit M [Nanoarchaeota archaeon]
MAKKQSWLDLRYDTLFSSFGNKSFTLDDAFKVLKEKLNEDKKSVAVVLSELRKKGLLNVKPSKEDYRKKIYTLISKGDFLKKTILAKEKLSRADIEALLKKAADLIRTRVSYDFILILLFLKRLSDKWELEFETVYKDALKDGLSEKEAREEAKNAAYHEFDLPEEYLWDNLRKDVTHLPENLSKALKELGERNPELKDVVDNVDFLQFTRNKENSELLRQLIELFSEKKLHNVSADILGDAYEWLLRYFAPQKAKEGEVYTPREVIKLLVEILDPKPKEGVYDPACGSGGMLIVSYKHVEEKEGKSKANKLFLYGQEHNPKTLALGRMNLYIHDIKNAQLAIGDTLLYPKFKEGGFIKQFDVVIANPPWNQDGYDEEQIKKGEFWKKRFPFGFSTKQSADWMWIQHMIASAKDKTGRVGVVIDNGCLFRGGREKGIRASIIEEDLIDTIVLLPEKLFYNTGAPGAIIFLRKNKPKERKGKILFINASKEFEKHPEVRKLNILSDKNIKKIVDAYNKFKDIEGFSRVVSLKEIKENDYNLNVSLYVFPEEKEEEIDVNAEWKEMKNVEKELLQLENQIHEYLKVIK